MKKTNVVHPGQVKSRHDGQWHWIGFTQLCQLYGIDPRTAVDASNPRNLLGFRDDGELRHYYPRPNGQYRDGAR